MVASMPIGWALFKPLVSVRRDIVGPTAVTLRERSAAGRASQIVGKRSYSTYCHMAGGWSGYRPPVTNQAEVESEAVTDQAVTGTATSGGQTLELKLLRLAGHGAGDGQPST
jgi:hypothetical protein